MERFLAQRSTMLIPGGAALREVRSQMDPLFREVDGYVATVQNSIPGFSSFSTS